MTQVTAKPTQADYDALKAQVAQLEASLQQAKAMAQQAIRFGVSAKGGISIYGINGKFPVTNYAGQWLRILDHGDKLREFIKVNEKWLSTKDVQKNYSDEELDKINGTNRVEKAAAKANGNGANGSATAPAVDLTPAEIAALEKRTDLDEQEQAVLNTAKLRLKLKQAAK